MPRDYHLASSTLCASLSRYILVVKEVGWINFFHVARESEVIRKLIPGLCVKQLVYLWEKSWIPSQLGSAWIS